MDLITKADTETTCDSCNCLVREGDRIREGYTQDLNGVEIHVLTLCSACGEVCECTNPSNDGNGACTHCGRPLPFGDCI